MIARCTAPLALVAALGASALGAPDKVELERKLNPGTRVRVDVRSVSTYQMIYQNKQAKVGGAEETRNVQRYVEEVRTRRPELLVRDYELSTRQKGRPKEKVEPINTSVHGRRVLVSGLEQKPQGFEMGKADRERIRLERLVEALLPPQKVVSPRDSWTITSVTLLRALFPPAFAAAQEGSVAKVTFKSIKTVKDVEVAVLKVKAHIEVARGENVPGIEMDLKGEVKWAIAAGLLLESDLKGPVAFEMDTGEAVVRAEGPFVWTYRAEILAAREAADRGDRKAGLPPPPGTKRLECRKQPEHQFGLEQMVRCLLCGKALDRDRRCPDGDPWPFQFCPHDGAPLDPR